MRRLYLGLLLALSATYLTMLLWSLPHLSRLASDALMFDLRPMGYSFKAADELIADLGEAGRHFYLTTQHRLDTLFPALELIVLIMSYFRLYSPRVAWLVAPLAAAGVAFDFLENAAVGVMLRAGEGLTPEMVLTASRYTQLKSVFVSVALTVLLFGALRLLWRRVKA